jgi:hypothetical protein
VKFWLIAYLFDVHGQLQAKDIYEAEGMQLHCISDDEYRQEIGETQ